MNEFTKNLFQIFKDEKATEKELKNALLEALIELNWYEDALNREKHMSGVYLKAYKSLLGEGK